MCVTVLRSRQETEALKAQKSARTTGGLGSPPRTRPAARDVRGTARRRARTLGRGGRRRMGKRQSAMRLPGQEAAASSARLSARRVRAARGTRHEAGPSPGRLAERGSGRQQQRRCRALRLRVSRHACLLACSRGSLDACAIFPAAAAGALGPLSFLTTVRPVATGQNQPLAAARASACNRDVQRSPSAAATPLRRSHLSLCRRSAGICRQMFIVHCRVHRSCTHMWHTCVSRQGASERINCKLARRSTDPDMERR